MPTGDDLRALMRRFPAPVAVLTFEVDGRRHGITVGSLVSLSLDPPLVGVSIGRDTSAHEPLRDADGFALSLLSGEQAAVAQHFARSVPPIAMWERVEAREGVRGPLLAGALAWIECRHWAEYDVGDHTFFVGEVQRLEPGGEGAGLVYREGSYHAA